MPAKPVNKRIPIARILTQCPLGTTQTRIETNADLVSEYAEILNENPDAFPAIDVFEDPENPGYYFLGDGFTRLGANKKVGFIDISANAHKGTYRDAILFGMKANQQHGLRLTNRDKRHMVTRMLKDDIWKSQPNTYIADATGTTAPFVLKVREELFPGTTKKRVPEPPPLPVLNRPLPGFGGTPMAVQGQRPAVPTSLAQKPVTLDARATLNSLAAVPHVNADRYSVPIPEKLQSYFLNDVAQLQEATGLITALQGKFNSALLRSAERKKPYDSRMIQKGQQISKMLDEVRKFINAEILPDGICPFCKAKEDCKFCSGMGWITKEERIRVPEVLLTTEKTATEIGYYNQVTLTESIENVEKDKLSNKFGEVINPEKTKMVRKALNNGK